MNGLGAKDLWWVAASAFVTVFAGWFAIKTRLGMTWLLNRARRGFVDWFGESIDKHVAPKFDEVRDELLLTSQQTQENTRIAADSLRVEQHAAIRSEISPLIEKVEAHIVADDRLMTAAGEALTQGQTALIERMDAHHQESMDLITAHVAEDAAAFERIEAQLKETP